MFWSVLADNSYVFLVNMLDLELLQSNDVDIL